MNDQRDADAAGEQAGLELVGAERRGDGQRLLLLEGQRERAVLQHVGQVLGLALGEAAGDLGLAVDRALDRRGRDRLAVEHERDVVGRVVRRDGDVVLGRCSWDQVAWPLPLKSSETVHCGLVEVGATAAAPAMSVPSMIALSSRYFEPPFWSQEAMTSVGLSRLALAPALGDAGQLLERGDGLRVLLRVDAAAAGSSGPGRSGPARRGRSRPGRSRPGRSRVAVPARSPAAWPTRTAGPRPDADAAGTPSRTCWPRGWPSRPAGVAGAARAGDHRAEPQLRGLADRLGRVTVRAGDRDDDPVRALGDHLGLGDTEAVDPALDDLPGLVERGTARRLVVGRLRLQGDLGAALEVEAELRGRRVAGEEQQRVQDHKDAGEGAEVAADRQRSGRGGHGVSSLLGAGPAAAGQRSRASMNRPAVGVLCCR